MQLTWTNTVGSLPNRMLLGFCHMRSRPMTMLEQTCYSRAKPDVRQEAKGPARN
jgi:hypothetical protein